MNDKANDRRRRGVWLGLLVVLLLTLGGYGYAVSSSPSASTGPSKGKPSASPTADVLAPQAPQTSAPAGSTTGGTGTGTGAVTQVVLAPAASSGNGNGGNCVEPSNGNGGCTKSFGVTVGHAQTLYPSLVRTLPVTYSNPNSFDIGVTTYRVSVSVPSSQSTACPASSLQVPSGTVTFNPQLLVPKNGSVTTTIPIKLSANAPAGCQSVTFSITVNASAVKK